MPKPDIGYHIRKIGVTTRIRAISTYLDMLQQGAPSGRADIVEPDIQCRGAVGDPADREQVDAARRNR